jgi:hypothetical protein
MPHRPQKDCSQRLRDNVPFGLRRTEPRHFRDMTEAAEKNRDGLPCGSTDALGGVPDGDPRARIEALRS